MVFDRIGYRLFQKQFAQDVREELKQALAQVQKLVHAALALC